MLVALVSEVFIESVQQAALAFGMTPAFVGFIVVALVGGAAEMGAAFSGARKNRLDLSCGGRHAIEILLGKFGGFNGAGRHGILPRDGLSVVGLRRYWERKTNQAEKQPAS